MWLCTVCSCSEFQLISDSGEFIVCQACDTRHEVEVLETGCEEMVTGDMGESEEVVEGPSNTITGWEILLKFNTDTNLIHKSVCIMNPDIRNK